MIVALCWQSIEAGEDTARAAALFKEARQLVSKNRNRMNEAALAKVEAAVEELDKAVAAGAEADWKMLSEVAWAAERSRENLGAYEKSLHFARMMMKLDKRGGRHRDARLQMAMTYRAMRDFKKAQETYDAIVAAKADDRVHILLPMAEMVYVEMGEKKRGRQLVDEALMNEKVANYARYRFVMDRAKHALSEGRRDEAIRWYGMVETMPDAKEKDRHRYLSQAWYEMGKIEESFGRPDKAKTLYRKAMALEGGNMHYRTLARNAIEGIEYFE
jgi:tetratricopeptide (TPR) repeat protein